MANVVPEMFELVDGHSKRAVIRVIGVGGGGCNTVNQMAAANIQGVEFISANTDRDHLEKTVRRFNGFVQRGADDDFHRGEHQWKLASTNAAQNANASLGTVAEPPFFGIELRPAGGSSVGLLADVRGQVIHQRRHPIPGLYASGNVAAATEHGVGYQAGLSLASSMTFSYLAVRHMIDGQ